MSEVIDAKGLSCPQPVLLALESIKKIDSDKLEVIVDTIAAKENVERAVCNKGWIVESEKEENNIYKLQFSRK